MARTCRGTLGEVRDGSEMSGTDWGTLVEFCDGSGDPRGGRGLIGRL